MLKGLVNHHRFAGQTAMYIVLDAKRTTAVVVDTTIWRPPPS